MAILGFYPLFSLKSIERLILYLKIYFGKVLLKGFLALVLLGLEKNEFEIFIYNFKELSNTKKLAQDNISWKVGLNLY